MANPLLEGVRILDLTRLLPGPFCTQYFAQLGAEVIKIEEPGGGDYTRAMMPELFAVVNRGKRSITLDLRLEQDQQRFKQLVADADMVVESFRRACGKHMGGTSPLFLSRPEVNELDSRPASHPAEMHE